ncbi:MAG TPA: hypothetical protein VL329_04620, partial [Nitrospiraceae bacterium]|nr:hypothetical protein [Nitrospiraceae bacterium]
ISVQQQERAVRTHEGYPTVRDVTLSLRTELVRGERFLAWGGVSDGIGPILRFTLLTPYSRRPRRDHTEDDYAGLEQTRCTGDTAAPHSGIPMFFRTIGGSQASDR